MTKQVQNMEHLWNGVSDSGDRDDSKSNIINTRIRVAMKIKTNTKQLNCAPHSVSTLRFVQFTLVLEVILQI